jgi:hypothetical protein
MFPTELIGVIVQYVHPGSVSNFLQVCKDYYSYFDEQNSIWIELYNNAFLDRNWAAFIPPKHHIRECFYQRAYQLQSFQSINMPSSNENKHGYAHRDRIDTIRFLRVFHEEGMNGVLLLKKKIPHDLYTYLHCSQEYHKSQQQTMFITKKRTAFAGGYEYTSISCGFLLHWYVTPYSRIVVELAFPVDGINIVAVTFEGIRSELNLRIYGYERAGSIIFKKFEETAVPKLMVRMIISLISYFIAANPNNDPEWYFRRSRRDESNTNVNI